MGRRSARITAMAQQPEDRDRDRDPAGRPLNARPRDSLGRPLPRGAAGDEPVLDLAGLTPEESLTRAQELLDSGHPFHAHEVLEASWKAAPDDERELWKGLAQLAVGLTHLMRGNGTGAVALLRRAQVRIGPYAGTSPHHVDVAGLVTWCDEALRTIAHAQPDEPSTIRPPQLTAEHRG